MDPNNDETDPMFEAGTTETHVSILLTSTPELVSGKSILAQIHAINQLSLLSSWTWPGAGDKTDPGW